MKHMGPLRGVALSTIFALALQAGALEPTAEVTRPTHPIGLGIPVTAGAAFHFLRQASWGPTAASIARVQQLGMNAWIDEQFGITPTPIPDAPVGANGLQSISSVQQQFFVNAMTGNDQLRQRVAFALSQIWVISGVKITATDGVTNWLRVLQKDAFANYYDVMYDVTLNPGMGHYLDMVNNDKANPALNRGENENYAREVLQLFTIGVNQLNPDGTTVLDSTGQPVPTYTQDTIEGFASIFTGWTYAPAPGKTSASHNPAYWAAPMVAVQANHDVGTKALLNGVTIQANQTAEKDLADGLGNIFQNPNLAPFISRQLIQHLVTSNPSPGYVERVASIFANNGVGVRGDLKSVVKAILLDSEARMGDTTTPSATEGHLTEPVLFMTTLLRELNATVALNNGLPGVTSALGQNVFLSPTVFNYFAPSYDIAETTVNAPEFQLLSTANAISRANTINTLVYGTVTGVTFDTTGLQAQAAKTSQLIGTLNTQLMGGTMSSDMQNSITTAVNAASGNQAKTQAALYLTASSWQYQIER